MSTGDDQTMSSDQGTNCHHCNRRRIFRDDTRRQVLTCDSRPQCQIVIPNKLRTQSAQTALKHGSYLLWLELLRQTSMAGSMQRRSVKQDHYAATCPRKTSSGGSWCLVSPDPPSRG